MSTAVETRTFYFEVPSTTTIPWKFEFHVELVFDESQWVVIKWKEHTAGSGRFMIRDCGITWKSLLDGWHRCSREAYLCAKEWNEMDDDPQDWDAK